MIKLTAIGNLGKDCLVNQVNGKNVINFSVAHTERFKDSMGVQKERVTWVECAYWTDRTAVAPYLKKGQQVYVEGTPEVRTYQKNDGTPGASLTLRVHSVQLLGSSKPEGSDGNHQPNTTQANSGAMPQDAPSFSPEPVEAGAADDLPF